jgi:DNA repair exonuclease SbcCD ATPase subunit
MKTITNMGRVLLSLSAAIALIATIGCSEGTTHKDVASARDKLQKEQQQTAETVHEGQQNVADAQRKAQNHTAAKPVTPDQPTADQQKVADAQQDANEKIAKQKEQERAAAGNLADKQQQLQETQARDAYVKQVETKLADTDKQIDGLKQRASNAQGADKDAINREIDTLKTQRDMAQKALNDLKGADLATWKNHQEQVRVALQDLDNSMRKLR